MPARFDPSFGLRVLLPPANPRPHAAYAWVLPCLCPRLSRSMFLFASFCKKYTLFSLQLARASNVWPYGTGGYAHWAQYTKPLSMRRFHKLPRLGRCRLKPQFPSQMLPPIAAPRAFRCFCSANGRFQEAAPSLFLTTQKAAERVLALRVCARERKRKAKPGKPRTAAKPLV